MSRSWSKLAVVVLMGCEASPPPVGQRIEHPSIALFVRLDSDGDGTLGVEELMSSEPQELLAQLDEDADGSVSMDELRANLERWPEDMSSHARHGAPALGPSKDGPGAEPPPSPWPGPPPPPPRSPAKGPEGPGG